jgi:Fur family ferric uptake transcriptional regulator
MTPQHFQRNTRQREVILEELCNLPVHPAATEVYDAVRRRLPKISLGTVYRNLDLLARMGIIQKLEFAGAETRFDGNRRPHDHVRCLRCGRIGDLAGPPLELSPRNRDDFAGYEVLGHRLQYVGICPSCQAAEQKVAR